MRALYLVLLLVLPVGCKHAGKDCEQEIHVKAPRQKVVVDVPENCPPPVATQSAPAPAQPQSAAVPQAAPAGVPVMAGQTGGMMAVSAPQLTPLNTTQTVRAPRTRLAMGLTTIHIPIPFVKLFHVPIPGEIQTTSTIPVQPPQQILQVQQQSFVPVPQMVQPAVVLPQTNLQPSPPPKAAPQAAPANCPPVDLKTLDELEKEIKRARELLEKTKQ